MKYQKGTKLKAGEDHLYYMDEFYNEEVDKLILVCGGLCGNFQYVTEDEVKVVDESHEQKMIDILVDVSATMKRLNENIEEIQEVFSQPCDCDNCDSCDALENLN